MEIRSRRVHGILVKILGFLVFLQTGLLVAYYAGDAIWGNQVWIIDAVGYLLPWLFVPSLILFPLAIISRSRVIVISATIPLLLFVLTYGRFFLPRGSTNDVSPTLTVMTYNVLDLNEQYDDVADQIEAYDPDVLGLHELEAEMARVLQERLSSQFPYREIEPGRGLFSRYPIEQYNAFQLAGDGHWAQQVVLDVDGRQLTLLNVHPRSPRMLYGASLGLPSGFASDKRDRDFDDLISRIAITGGALVVMGDMNLSDRNDYYAEISEYLLDAHREKGWGLGFTRTNYPEIGLPTWRIDYVFYSPDLTAISADVGEFAGSDHRPVVAQIGFPDK